MGASARSRRRALSVALELFGRQLQAQVDVLVLQALAGRARERERDGASRTTITGVTGSANWNRRGKTCLPAGFG